MSSHEPHGDDHEELPPVRGGATHPEVVPSKSSSFFRRRLTEEETKADEQPAPVKSRSALQRLGIAPILSEPDPQLDRPPRSPTGAIRSISGIRVKITPVAPQPEGTVSTTVAPQTAAAAAASAAVGTVPWHSMTEEEIFAELSCTHGVHGLTGAEAEERVLKYGKNVITPPPTTHWLIKLLLLLVGGFQLMMIGGGVLCFIVYIISKGTDVQSLALGIVLIVVVLVSAGFQHYQEGKADKIMESLRQLTAESVYAFRDGTLQQIPAELLVPGDIVKVNSGEKVPADLRILSSSDLKVNNAPLTGENVDIKLGPNANHALLYEAKNVARSGCNFTSGNGIGVVFLTGDNTFFGIIAKSTTAVEHPDTLMKRQIRRLIFILGAFATFLGVLFLILSLLSGYTWIQSVLFLISIIVANVPEGLLPQLTVALSITAKRLQARGVLVSNLEIIETLGAVTVICSDKTGTLTCNRMTATHIVYNAQISLASENAPRMPEDTFQVFDASDASFKILHECLALNTDAVFMQTAEAEPDVLKRLVKGDASETAMVKFVEPLRPIAQHRAACKRLAAIPFNSSNKWMLSINEQEGDPENLPLRVFVKGAPERIMGMCSAILINGDHAEFNSEYRKVMDDINITLGKRGERVIAMAYTELDRGSFPPGFEFETDPPNFPMGGLTLIGFTALIDPPRPTVFNAVEECHSAGVRVIMVTGDHPITARSIAKSLNMITQKTKEEMEEEGIPVPEDYHGAIVVHGTDMQKFDQHDWDFVLAHDEVVFARTMPQQKQELVQQLAMKNHIVAMTGDGVNDAPALKAAHVGIAMYSGAAVAKEAAQLVLLEDDFSAIVEGIREGRLIFDNLKKCIAYVLSSNVPELVPFLAFIAGKIPLAIETIIILTIDVGTDLLPAVSLAFEDAEDSIMKRPPRRRDAHLVGFRMFCICYFTIGLIETGAAFHGFLVTLDDYGFPVGVLKGSGMGFRDSWEKLDEDQRAYFKNTLCPITTKYHEKYPNGNCQEDFCEYRNEALGTAQGAFLAAVVWGQVANVLARKTMLATIFTPTRMFANKVMLFSFLTEFGILALLLYTPGLNTVFLLHGPTARQLFCTLWVIPAILLYEEVRKAICRRFPTSWFAMYSGI